MAQLDALIGKPLSEVADILGDQFSFRVVERDGEPCVVTRDVKTDRVNLRLADRKVVGYSIG